MLAHITIHYCVYYNWHALGDSDFNTVLTANDEIAQAFKNSASKEDGLYRMSNSYNVIVVPSGIAGAWYEGHLDSFLLSPWALRIQDSSNLEAAANYLSNFYSTFLRCSDTGNAVTNWDTSYRTES